MAITEVVTGDRMAFLAGMSEYGKLYQPLNFTKVRPMLRNTRGTAHRAKFGKNQGSETHVCCSHNIYLHYVGAMYSEGRYGLAPVRTHCSAWTIWRLRKCGLAIEPCLSSAHAKHPGPDTKKQLDSPTVNFKSSRAKKPTSSTHNSDGGVSLVLLFDSMCYLIQKGSNESYMPHVGVRSQYR